MSIRAQERTTWTYRYRPDSDEVMPTTENIQVPLEEDLVVGSRSLEAEGNPKTEDVLNGRNCRLCDLTGESQKDHREVENGRLRSAYRSCRTKPHAHPSQVLLVGPQHHIAGNGISDHFSKSHRECDLNAEVL